MSIITKRGKWIILIVLIMLVLSGIYIIKSGSQKFEILDTDKVNSINYPGLKIALEATEECNNLEQTYKDFCYKEIFWSLGRYYGNTPCEVLKEKSKPYCYRGCGRSVGEKYSPDIKTIQDECSKTAFYKMCLLDAAIPVGKESAKHIETEQCQEFEQENAKQRCYDGLGRQLARDNKEQSLCKKTNDEESCLLGFADAKDSKGNREEALQICKQLNEEYAKKCYPRIGGYSISVYNKTIEEAFKDCEQYTYAEECKQGVAAGIIRKFFAEKQQRNETPLIITFTIDKTTGLTETTFGKIPRSAGTIFNEIIRVVETFLRNKGVFITNKGVFITNLTLFRGVILFSPLEILAIIYLIRNKKVQKVISLTTKKGYSITINLSIKVYNFLIQNLTVIIRNLAIITQNSTTYLVRTIKRSSKFLIQKILIIYKELTLVIHDFFSIDKTTINSLFKELKSELKSKEGKKKLLLISGIVFLTTIGNMIITDYHITFALIFYFHGNRCRKF